MCTIMGVSQKIQPFEIVAMDMLVLPVTTKGNQYMLVVEAVIIDSGTNAFLRNMY